MNDDLLLIGTIARAHGNKGQVIVNPESDFADERFREGASLLVGEPPRPHDGHARRGSTRDAR